jgi:hypothetical protein
LGVRFRLGGEQEERRRQLADLSMGPDEIRHDLRCLGASFALGMGVSADEVVNTESIGHADGRMVW